jgi:cobalt-zinc-cadmium efflux system membrane fusion protein
VEIQGQYAAGTAAELFTVGDVGRVWVIADVFESDLARVKVGDKASVTVVSNPGKHFEGKVEWISGVLDPGTRSAKVRCAFDNPDGQLKPEMYATARIAVQERKSLAIARASLVRLGDQTIVFVRTGTTSDGREKFERIPVTVDDVEGSTWVPVLYGLEKGAKVVNQGAARLSSAI